MKKLVLVSSLISVLLLVGCGTKNKVEDATEKTEHTQATEKTAQIKTAEALSVTNNIRKGAVKITALNTSLSQKEKYYYQVTVENTGTSPINIQSEQIKLVDSFGKEHAVGLVDRELISPIFPQKSVTGLVAFDSVKVGTPKFIKFDD
ncbi:DUF4352 domain-containing protein [Acinetobacter sp. MD2(2019)]|uniref:DUF4352 domain-containing protein n=1 Tax=Acinetobacter sp. MD2(2019) TaxID=2605273 RepID=UPI002D1E7B95|nr:DUF4352 domain-containing protein [Acinetobacter sp. MD2(2019)]MEB3753072.1 hypothetical protein [Acinetobacter sp. MD2(2019)]